MGTPYYSTSSPKTLRRNFAFGALVALICLIGLAVRLHFINHPMRYDESYNYLHYAVKPIGFIVTHYVPNNHVLHTLMVHISAGLFGDSPASLRLPALVGGMFLIPATAWLAWSISRRRLPSILVAIMVAGSAALVEYSTNARGYSWLALSATLQLILTIRLIEGHTKRIWWLCWGLLGALGAYTNPVMVIWTVALSVALACVVLFRRTDVMDERPWQGMGIGLSAAILLAGALYCPILFGEGLGQLMATHRMSNDILSAQTPTFPDSIGRACDLFMLGVGPLSLLVFVIGTVAGTAGAPRHASIARTIAILTTVLSVAMIGLLRAPLPARAWLFLWPVILALAAVGLDDFVEALRKKLKFEFLPRLVTCAACVCVALPVFAAWNAQYLSSEPGGLVVIEPAVDRCIRFGAEHCAIVSRYTPATTYYLRHKRVSDLPLPSQPETEQVVIVTGHLSQLQSLWNPAVPGYWEYGPAEEDAGLHVAHRRKTIISALDANP